MPFHYPIFPHSGMPLSPKSSNLLSPKSSVPAGYDYDQPTTPTQTPSRSRISFSVTPPFGHTRYHRHTDHMPTPEHEVSKSSPRGNGGPPTLPTWKTSDMMSKPQTRPSYSMPAEGISSYGASRGMPLAIRRRKSRYDPMGRDDEDEDAYEELGPGHPLRRVAEEDGKGDSLTLPGIKALFGVAGGMFDGSQEMRQLTAEHGSTPPATGSVFPSPSLPSLVPNSPSSSPSTARTSRYSSFASNMSSVSETSSNPAGFVRGWWAPEFERSTSSTASSPRNAPGYRAASYPSTQAFIDDHADKRRRSDGSPTPREAEESARLRWQAQSRNASYPLSAGQSPAAAPNGGLRNLLHPPPSSSSMSRQSVSGSSSVNTPLTLFHEHGAPSEYPFDRRIAPVPSRNGSLVGSQLAQSFADLSANERDRRSPLASAEMSHSGSASTSMAPPMLPSERRGSSYPATSGESSPHLSLPPLSVPRPRSTGPDALRRQSVTRSSSPDQQAALRRSSLTEMIKASSGDGVAMGSSRYPSTSRSSTPGPAPIPLERSSLSESSVPLAQSAGPIITGWPPRRVSHDSAMTPPGTPGIHLPCSEGEGSGHAGRGRKRSAQMDVDTDMRDHAMSGMEVLAESASARRVSEAAAEDEDSPTKGMIALSGAGPKYACAFCAKTFSRPSSLRIHTYSRKFLIDLLSDFHS